MAASAARDPLGPISYIVNILSAFVLSIVLVGLLLTAVGAHPAFGAWGDSYATVQTSTNGVNTSLEIPWTQEGGVRPGVMARAVDRVGLRPEHMSQADRTLVSLPVLVDWLWLIGFLALLKLVIRRARRAGLFTRQVARGLHMLGWYILAGSLAVAVLGAVLISIASSHLLAHYDMVSGIQGNLDINWATIVGGFATLSIGHVMERTVPMREEIEATV